MSTKNLQRRKSLPTDSLNPAESVASPRKASAKRRGSVQIGKSTEGFPFIGSDKRSTENLFLEVTKRSNVESVIASEKNGNSKGISQGAGKLNIPVRKRSQSLPMNSLDPRISPRIRLQPTIEEISSPRTGQLSARRNSVSVEPSVGCLKENVEGSDKCKPTKSVTIKLSPKVHTSKAWENEKESLPEGSDVFQKVMEDFQEEDDDQFLSKEFQAKITEKLKLSPVRSSMVKKVPAPSPRARRGVTFGDDTCVV